ncbi:circadian clock KaiB family protein [Amycolatopsis sp. CA-230715]|uniref:circadian clock KaiB family protein n=1 Tax=Amycolatopsis sp. CA-230715 TaxID=2745196 RepID=UPI001C00B977|nr:circadian clock KaiB family protein [Amycolatopsis sp. CA-230715]QWF85292.1 Circadian clock protein KaiB [Amycolatopsis sp. CA-230715]
MSTYSFRLYVAGHTERSHAAQMNLRALCEALFPGRYHVEVIDVTEEPGLAEEERILATPTVIRVAPPPRQRVIGDLADRRRTALALGLPEVAASSPQGDAT